MWPSIETARDIKIGKEAYFRARNKARHETTIREKTMIATK